jgi:hypothetical protein
MDNRYHPQSWSYLTSRPPHNDFCSYLRGITSARQMRQISSDNPNGPEGFADEQPPGERNSGGTTDTRGRIDGDADNTKPTPLKGVASYPVYTSCIPLRPSRPILPEQGQSSLRSSGPSPILTPHHSATPVLGHPWTCPPVAAGTAILQPDGLHPPCTDRVWHEAPSDRIFQELRFAPPRTPWLGSNLLSTNLSVVQQYNCHSAAEKACGQLWHGWNGDLGLGESDMEEGVAKEEEAWEALGEDMVNKLVKEDQE